MGEELVEVAFGSDLLDGFCRWRPARTAVHFLLGDKKGTKKAPVLCAAARRFVGKNLIQAGSFLIGVLPLRSSADQNETLPTALVSF